jgi:hypothetical protein
VCGNLLEGSIEQAWRSVEMQRWREMIPAECHGCAAFSQCHGGCRAMAAGRGLPVDPLAGDPLTDQEQAVEPVSLYEGLRPTRAYELRVEDFGLVLMRGNHIVPVPHQAQDILALCDGRTTLCQIGERFGQPGLYLIYALYEKGVLLLS